MNTAETRKSREGKYCPRCRTMTVREREVCEHCGHRFRTGLGTGLGTGLSASALEAPITEEAALHRTMQFTLPPLLPPRGAGAGLEAAPALPSLPRRRRLTLPAIVAGLPALALLGVWAAHTMQAARAARPSPAGVWETSGSGQASHAAHLAFDFRDGGGGSFSWGAGGARPLSGQTPLRWRLDAGGRLVLSITPPTAVPDPLAGQLIPFFGSRPWLWRVDRPRHRLIIGPLSLTEK